MHPPVTFAAVRNTRQNRFAAVAVREPSFLPVGMDSQCQGRLAHDTAVKAYERYLFRWDSVTVPMTDRSFAVDSLQSFFHTQPRS